MIKRSILTLLALGLMSVPLSASARPKTRTYILNRTIDSAHIYSSTVERLPRQRGTRLHSKFSLPTCKEGTYLYGTIQVSFFASDGTYMGNYTVFRALRSEVQGGQSLERSVESFAQLGLDGRFNHRVNLTCRVKR